MPELTIEIQVWCNDCGEGLCRFALTSGGDVHVGACPKCIERAEEAAYDKGLEDGRMEGS